MILWAHVCTLYVFVPIQERIAFYLVSIQIYLLIIIYFRTVSKMYLNRMWFEDQFFILIFGTTKTLSSLVRVANANNDFSWQVTH